MRLILVILLICSSGMSMSLWANGLADDDRDGVINARDKCPQTKLALKVDSMGCQQVVMKVKRILLNIPFKSGSAYIHPRYNKSIEVVAKQLNRYPLARLSLIGHTSTRGLKDANQMMAMARAQRVASVLIEQYNIAVTRITLESASAQSALSSSKVELAERRVVAYISRHQIISHHDYIN